MESRNKKALVVAATPSTTVPQDLAVEILSRLPVQSVWRFRSACKDWHNLVMNRAIAAAAGNDHPNIIYSSKDTGTGLTSLYIIKPPLQQESDDESISHEQPSHTELNLDYCPLSGESTFQASCNGLLCFSFYKDRCVILVNPTTRRLKLSPPEEFVISRNGVIFGFGYDSTTDDYKVVRIDQNSDVKVYSMSTNSWRRVVNGIPNVHLSTQPGIFFNGAIHWVTTGLRLRGGIPSFDVKEEEFRRVLLPPTFDDDTERWTLSYNLLIMRECLGMIRVPLCSPFHDHDVFEVWVMKEYGRRESWTKQFVFKNPELNKPQYCSMIGNHILLKYHRWGSDKEYIDLYDIKTRKTVMSFKPIGSPTGRRYAPSMCIGNLVSLKSKERIKGRQEL